jgi:hypothetical protein
MGSKEKLSLNDLPTIDELKERFKNREENLKRMGSKNAEEVSKGKNAVTYNFIIGNFPMLEMKDKELVGKLGKNLIRYGVLSIFAPSIINIGLAKMTQNRIYNLHSITRFSFRLAIYVVPIFLYTDYAFAAYTRSSMYLTDKYADRVELFMKIGDPKIINPKFEEENKDMQ